MSLQMTKRTCPWCGIASVYAITEERARTALADHLRECTGDGEPPRAEPDSTHP